MESDFIEAQLERAAELLDAGKPAQALRCLDPIRDKVFESSDQIECASLEGWALSELGRADEAVELLRPFLEQFPDSSRLFGTLGVVLSGVDRLEEACDVLERAVELDETDGALLANLGYVHEKLHDSAAATRLYDRSLYNGADVGWVLRRLATVQSDMDEHAAARATLRRYLSLCPEDATEWVSLGIAHSELGEFDDSFDCYQRAESLRVDGILLHYNWGLTAERADQLQTARAHLRQLTAIAADAPQADNLRGFILEHEGDLSAAYGSHLSAIERAVGAYWGEKTYAYETAMDFCADHKLHEDAKRLIRRAYANDACSVALCEAYRELTGQQLARGFWFGMMLDDRRRRSVAADSAGSARAGITAASRRCQVIAEDRDHAIALLTEFVHEMGDGDATVTEFVDEESLEDVFSGIYEIEARGDKSTRNELP